MSPDAYILLGIFMGLLFTELTGVSPGGLIVPGYIALYLREPLAIALTVTIALVTMGILRLASRYALLYGRRRFAVSIIAACALSALARRFLPSISPALAGLRAVGWIVPGIIASDMEKQGPVKTLLAMGAVVAVVYTVSLAWAWA
ncbi:MAG: poly-gamma-glutamate biosynthesis protein PgsC [Spirochaetes bacterium]|nr:poly-gamma-glutamate biosynthesis protein PgsC [Spirochaetota bacterium]MBU1080523.1 poly-gamma-glutamate biosynthesis protein PgsC [Spirochaetota bacterium]